MPHIRRFFFISLTRGGIIMTDKIRIQTIFRTDAPELRRQSVTAKVEQLIALQARKQAETRSDS
jgi:hypothetical protein